MTRNNLHVYAFDPASDDIQFLFNAPRDASTAVDAGAASDSDVKSVERLMFPLNSSSNNHRGGRFIIGNHADELQPWVPALAALTDAEYLSIPCCAWEFDQRYQMKKRRTKKGGNSNVAAGDDPSLLDIEEDGNMDDEGVRELEDLEQKLKHGEPDGALSLYACEYLFRINGRP